MGVARRKMDVGETRDPILSCVPSKVDLQSVEYIPGELLKSVEERLIAEVLRWTNGNKTRAAKILGISVRTLRYKTASRVELER